MCASERLGTACTKETYSNRNGHITTYPI